MQLLRDIALFVEIVNTKSFTKAAEHLEMPASTLSRRIHSLEQQIGLSLLTRTTRRVEVTEAGAAYYAKCAPLVEEARVAHEDLLAQTRQVRGTLRMTCSADFANHYLLEVLTQYTQRYPDVEVELDQTSRLVDLVAENFDVALRLGRLPDSTLVAKRLAQLRPVLVASPGYIHRAPPLVAPDSLQQHMCIRMNARESESQWTLIHQVSREQQTVHVKGRFSVTSAALIKALALQGGGVAMLDQSLVHHELQTGRLVHVLPHWGFLPVDVNWVTPSRLMPARVRLFGDLLTEALQKHSKIHSD